ncbi:MAG: Ubiquinone/menaquinone biosynthesis C-methyltransferase UbiE [Candidatus Hydrogenedentes bacterium ADurb.Bin101]|nr:MAG: Ubiquinone/menaquinone biosynthesis C-methyltransferase UbiE [Candidatus Hydrogenedentes bacterium ADurb.Bin101]HOC70967.1 bifunctional demethylmenaquinone methyltransferase/2-methoxy-6-polyprenyl-1,4-benzoquinol methylase UbiE [Candidatus Hydrogenedentota bacterium]
MPIDEKRGQIQGMFDAIAAHYDCINRWLSLRRDAAWRNALLVALPCSTRMTILDLATGTGEVLLSLVADKYANNFVVGADISAAMLHAARQKIEDDGKEDCTALTMAAAESLCFADNTFDLVTVAFGVRNFSDRDAGLAEMYRVLRHGGRILVLEFSLPENGFIRSAYLVYFRRILPFLAGLISRHPAAYRYLNRSVEEFPESGVFSARLKAAGFQRIALQRLTFGIATLYIAYKTH